jgi:sulfide:quinone oxidoreductase
MTPIALSDVIAVGEVPTAAEIEILAKAGFRSLLNTQPDGEVDRLMSAAEVAALGQAAGLAVRHLPVPSRRPTEAVVTAFATALAELPRPIYACCYSGSRAAAAWAFAAVRKQSPEAVIAACTAAGYDVSFLAAALAAAHGEAATAPAGTPSAPDVPPLTPAPVPRAASAGGFALPG